MLEDKTLLRQQLFQLLNEKKNRMSRESLLEFTLSTMPTFVPADYHKRYYSILTDFAEGNIKKLMVFLPPQHGKSEGSTRRLPAYMLGRDPDLKIAVVSYNSTKARKFNREIQRIMDMPEYSEIFPDTKLGGTGAKSGVWARSSEEFEIIDHRGSCKTVGVGGPLTGEPVDILIMDDLYKDAKSAWSPIIRSTVNDWYNTVAETRLHNDSQQLIVFTRWHQEDLAGVLINKQGVYDEIENPNGWVIVTYPAIKEGEPTEYDPREEGEALWPERHSLEQLQEVRKRDPHVFESLYQQNPKPQQGLLYELGFKTYSTIPITRMKKRKNYTDTADEGKDFHCSIDYVETEVGLYVLDVLYTQKPMEYTEVAQADMMTKDRIEYAKIESNNGGRGFARNVERNMRLKNNNYTHVSWFHQSNNKAARIFTMSSEVQNLVHFPEGWNIMWPSFYNALMSYMKVGQNEHDDAADAITGLVEEKEKSSTTRVADYF